MKDLKNFLWFIIIAVTIYFLLQLVGSAIKYLKTSSDAYNEKQYDVCMKATNNDYKYCRIVSGL